MTEDTKTLSEADLRRAEELLRDPDGEDCERFASRYGHTLIDIARAANAAPSKTLRDEFAMAALTGWLADGVGSSADMIAQRVYEVADAMMAARAKSSPALNEGGDRG